MNNDSRNHILEVWVGEECLLDTPASHPLVMHGTPRDDSPEHAFWNEWRDALPGVVQVRQFSRLDEAGRFVVIPHAVWDYRRAGRMRQMLGFKERVLRSGRVPVLYTAAYEYRRRRGEILFNTGRYLRSWDRAEANVATPAWLFDIGDDAAPLEKPDVPTIGFVGATAYPSRTQKLMKLLPLPWWALRLLACSGELNSMLPLTARFQLASSLRARALRAAGQSRSVKASLINRDRSFFSHSAAYKEQARQEYVRNIKDNAYTLCIRGTENYSYRLFEVMSAGRLPIIIDTNMRLPSLAGFGDWGEFSVFVPIGEIGSLGDHVRRFHDALSAEGFQRACRRAREAFEYLLPSRFFPRLVADGFFDREVE
jgi:hypothetical protein